MMPPVEDRGAMTPQLALRVTVIGSIALLMFAIIFFRLWFLQVLSGSTYVAQATTNLVRKVPIAAARGNIIDRDGNVLVESVPTPAVMIAPSDLPVRITLPTLDALAAGQPLPAPDMALFGRLGRLLGISSAPLRTKCHVYGYPPPRGPGGNYVLAEIPCAVVQSVSEAPYQNVPIKTNVSPYLQDYLLERQPQYPGVAVQTAYLRRYPLGGAGAQVFGTVQTISCLDPKSKVNCETHLPHFRGIPAYDKVGQSGLEYEYNPQLQGADGNQTVIVNAQGQFEGYGKPSQPTTGETLQTSLSAALERVGQQALQTSIASNYPADAGSFIAMNPDDGQVYAMGSFPTYDPTLFTHPLSQAEVNQLERDSHSAPLLNRATQSAGPTGSTFKPITAIAALQSGNWLVSDTFDDTGQLCFPGGLCLHNAGHAANGSLDLVSALRVSDDVFFYNLGARTNVDPVAHPLGGPLQHWARAFGIGRNPGIDLPAALSGTLPSPAWRAGRNRLEHECETATGPYRGKPKHVSCGIADGNPWTIGDNVNLAVGQGDVQVTPLQLAVVYAALANGGNIVTPHLGMDIRDANGTIVQRIDPGIRRHLTLDPTYLSTVLTGLHEAAQSPGGTSDDVMGNFPLPVYGKTGTAQYTGQNDYAWYACFVPASATSKPIVVVVKVEQGGFGDVAAAPVARQILNQWFFGRAGTYHAGASNTL